MVPQTVESPAYLPILIIEVGRKAVEVEQAVQSLNWLEAKSRINDLRASVRTLKEQWPASWGRADLKKLEQHAVFIDRYASRKDAAMVRSNLIPLQADLRKVASFASQKGGELVSIIADVTKISEFNARTFLEEAVRCILAEAPRAAAVMTVCSLEGAARHMLKARNVTNSEKMHFASVIDTLEKQGVLTSGEAAILGICRSFRNLAAHPSDFKFTMDEVMGLLRLAVSQFRKGLTQNMLATP